MTARHDDEWRNELTNKKMVEWLMKMDRTPSNNAKTEEEKNNDTNMRIEISFRVVFALANGFQLNERPQDSVLFISVVAALCERLRFLSLAK